MKTSADIGLTKPMLSIAAIICLGLVVLFVFPDREMDQLPQDIFGEWYSEDPRYKTCFVNINTHTFIIGGADGNTYYYDLKSVVEETTNSGKGRFYTLLCEDGEGMELEFRIYHDADTGMLSYKNQRDVIWFKAKKTAAPKYSRDEQ